MGLLKLNNTKKMERKMMENICDIPNKGSIAVIYKKLLAIKARKTIQQKNRQRL